MKNLELRTNEGQDNLSEKMDLEITSVVPSVDKISNYNPQLSGFGISEIKEDVVFTSIITGEKYLIQGLPKRVYNSQ